MTKRKGKRKPYVIEATIDSYLNSQKTYTSGRRIRETERLRFLGSSEEIPLTEWLVNEEADFPITKAPAAETIITTSITAGMQTERRKELTQINTWNADSYQTSRKISHFCGQKFHHIHRTRTWDNILVKLNPVHTITPL